MNVILAAIAIYVASILTARISYHNFLKANANFYVSPGRTVWYVLKTLALPQFPVVWSIVQGADAPAYMAEAAFFMMIAWAFGGIAQTSPFREFLQTMPKVIHTEEEKGLKRFIADLVNVTALPFFAGCALLVFGIAMLMRFGGRATR
ncbi:MAG: hypothetical protein K2X77_30805 [Candidatus Obscuribacterales bacterium]|nr:hypothetical protein [Candidatus Obscuribacterales bacterium]